MKKKILSQLMILSFAFAGLFLVGNNVFAEQETTPIINPEPPDCTQTTSEGWYCLDVCRHGGEVGAYCRQPKK